MPTGARVGGFQVRDSEFVEIRWHVSGRSSAMTQAASTVRRHSRPRIPTCIDTGTQQRRNFRLAIFNPALLDRPRSVPRCVLDSRNSMPQFHAHPQPEADMEPLSPSGAEATAGNVGVPAGYGRSCTNCSRAKRRCILNPEGGSCEMCSRTGKECVQMETRRVRHARVRRNPTSMTAKLEAKLNDLVSILRAGQNPSQQVHPNMHSSSQTPSSSSSQAQPSRLDSLAAAAAANPQPGTSFYMGQTSCGDDPSHTKSAYYVRPEPTPEEAEIYLSKFREWLSNFPFMHIPSDLTAEALRRERPFLWMSIMNMTSMSLPQQHMLRERVREEVANRLVLNHERTMDILLGLLAYLGW